MKVALFLTVMMIAQTLLPGSVSANSGLGTAWVPISRVYAPAGFDSNDDTQVVVSGYLPNLCYKAPRTEVSVTGRTITITVKALIKEDTIFCPQMIVPFLEPVSVGVLSRGSYRIVVNGSSEFEKSSEIRVVEAASSAVDNHVYANLSYIEKTEGSRRIILKGYNPSDCFEFDRVEFMSNEKDAYSVLPILRQVKSDCPKRMVPFSIEAVVPKGLPIEDLLLHARAMDGKSVNTLFDNQ
jgi:hypothetical protein